MAKLPLIAPVISTTYRGPTDHKGSRVIAKNVSSGKRQTVGWDHALGADENHFEAAKAVLHDGWHIVSMCGVDGGGYLFTTGLDGEVG